MTDDRGRRDDAGVGPYLRGGARLARLRDLGDWHLADGEPDIRGWEVRTLGGRTIGEVDELLIDTDQRRVLMLDIDLVGTGRRTLAPMRAAQVDRVERVVHIDTADLREKDIRGDDAASGTVRQGGTS